ncbi:MAG: GTPase Era [Hyphomicrobium sp. 32-62-53]|nr:MAG: GTPase Era [Hyphomicrobium sp. 12-62-95]OYX98787.1 MAG: GTPase Era [Hyphomicrobium sp. 32-62-53]
MVDAGAEDMKQPDGGNSAGETRCGFVAVIGAPNAGKSTLVNQMVGAKVSIVSHKVQTTRVPLRGIAIEGKSQLVFIDTPGIFSPKRRLDRAMVEAAWGGAHDADIVVMLVDAAKGIEEDLERILAKLADAPHAKILVLNKVDRVSDKDRLLPLIARLSEKQTFDRVFLISALDGNGVADLKRYLAERMPLGPWHYPEDEISDAPLRMLASELTREKIYEYLHEELPYSTTVETTDWKAFKNGSVRIEQTIYVERDSQKAIVLGKKGQTIKRISSESRNELAKILEHDVHLFLFVKVRENWGSDPERYREMGLNFPKD